MTSDKIILNEDDKTISDKKEFYRTFRTYFAYAVSDLQISNVHRDAFNIMSNHDLVLAAVNTFQNHPNVINIKHIKLKSVSSFKNTNEHEIDEIIKNLNVCIA